MGFLFLGNSKKVIQITIHLTSSLRPQRGNHIILEVKKRYQVKKSTRLKETLTSTDN